MPGSGKESHLGKKLRTWEDIRKSLDLKPLLKCPHRHQWHKSSLHGWSKKKGKWSSRLLARFRVCVKCGKAEGIKR